LENQVKTKTFDCVVDNEYGFKTIFFFFFQ